MIWNLRGTSQQNALVQSAIDACSFPFDELAPSLAREGKTSIAVEWADLSRFTHTAEAHDHADGAHTIIREVEGRARVLGLFYLPPHTKVVLDNALINHPDLAREVFLAEGAHAVDYHYAKERGLRRAIWNALHADHEDTPADVPESGDIGHGHSWFDGPGGYSTWVGESFMALFVKAFAPTVPVTINLAHPITAESVEEVRAAFDAYLNPAPEPTPEPEPSANPVYAGTTTVFHDSHKRIEPTRWFDSSAEAVAAGFRPCKVCKPV